MARKDEVSLASGEMAFTFSQFSRDEEGFNHGHLAVIAPAVQGSASFSFHPGENCLVTFLHSASEDFPTYRTDRHWSERERRVAFCLGRHDDSRLMLAAYLRDVEDRWSLEATIIIRPEELRKFADALQSCLDHGVGPNP